MVTKKQYETVDRMQAGCQSYRIINGICSLCGVPLERISCDERFLIDLSTIERLYTEVYKCSNPECDCHKYRIKPNDYLQRIIPGSRYGVDIFAKVGFLRFKEHKTVEEILTTLKTDHPHIVLSLRHTENLVNWFMHYMASNAENGSSLADKLKSKGVKSLVLSIDGLEPDKGNSILYIVREMQTGEPVFVSFLDFSDTDTLVKKVFNPVKSIVEQSGLPLTGWVVDKQQAFTTGINQVFDTPPIQWCQSHFLKDVRKPVREEDTNMGKDIKKNFEEYVK